jgi:hypothetical protein
MATKLGWQKPQPPQAPDEVPAPSGGIFEKVGDGPWQKLDDHGTPGAVVDDSDLPWASGWWPK